MKITDFAIVSERCSRPSMEDSHNLDLAFQKKGRVFGIVCDGHGDSKPAVETARQMPGVFSENLKKHRSQRAFINSYEALDRSMEWAYNCGTCAVSFFLANGTIHHANVGDCRVVIINSDIIILTTDHRVSDDEEKRRITKAGGMIFCNRVYHELTEGNMGLMPTRTLGDHYFRDIGVIPTPSVGSYKIEQNDKFLIAASDGLFDNISQEMVFAASVKSNTSRDLANELEKTARLGGNGDNLTIIVLRF